MASGNGGNKRHQLKEIGRDTRRETSQQAAPVSSGSVEDNQTGGKEIFPGRLGGGKEEKSWKWRNSVTQQTAS